MLIEWKDGHATIPAPTPNDAGRHWRLTVAAVSLGEIEAYGGERYGWDAVLIHLPDCRAAVSRHRHYGDAPTARAAQWACEAALLRLGVLSLPAWHRPDWASGGAYYEQIAIGGIVASVGHNAAKPSPCGWHLSRGDGSGTGKVFLTVKADTEAAAKAAAERHLRAELAAWLAAQAEQEGA